MLEHFDARSLRCVIARIVVLYSYCVRKVYIAECVWLCLAARAVYGCVCVYRVVRACFT